MAWVGLATTLQLQLANFGLPGAENMLKAEYALNTTLGLNDHLAEAHSSITTMQYMVYNQYNEAVQRLSQLLAMHPSLAGMAVLVIDVFFGDPGLFGQGVKTGPGYFYLTINFVVTAHLNQLMFNLYMYVNYYL